jgi:hypothetical protein
MLGTTRALRSSLYGPSGWQSLKEHINPGSSESCTLQCSTLDDICHLGSRHERQLKIKNELSLKHQNQWSVRTEVFVNLSSTNTITDDIAEQLTQAVSPRGHSKSQHSNHLSPHATSTYKRSQRLVDLRLFSHYMIWFARATMFPMNLRAHRVAIHGTVILRILWGLLGSNVQCGDQDRISRSQRNQFRFSMRFMNELVSSTGGHINYDAG